MDIEESEVLALVSTAHKAVEVLNAHVLAVFGDGEEPLADIEQLTRRPMDAVNEALERFIAEDFVGSLALLDRAVQTFRWMVVIEREKMPVSEVDTGERPPSLWGLAAALMQQGTVLLSTGDADGAMRSAVRAMQVLLSLPPSNPVEWILLGRGLGQLVPHLNRLGQVRLALGMTSAQALVCSRAFEVDRGLWSRLLDAFDQQAAQHDLLGEIEVGLAVRRKAVEAVHGLGPAVTRALTTLSGRLAELGRGAEAAEVAHEARADVVQLASFAQGEASLGLAGRLAEAGRLDEALAVGGQAVEVMRRRAQGASTERAFARGLSTWARILDLAGRPEARVAALRESVDRLGAAMAARPELTDAPAGSRRRILRTRRRGAEAGAASAAESRSNPPDALTFSAAGAGEPRPASAARLDRDVYLWHCNQLLLAHALWGVGEVVECHQRLEEAVASARQLAEADGAQRPELVAALSTQGQIFGFGGHYAASVAPFLEALQLQEVLAQEAPETEDPNLAQCLFNLVIAALGMQKFAQVLRWTEALVPVRRRIAERDPTQLDALVSGLEELGRFRARVGDAPGALAAYQEVIERVRPRATAEWGQEALVSALAGAGSVYISMKRPEDARPCYDEALERFPACQAPLRLPAWRLFFEAGGTRLQVGDAEGALAALLESAARVEDPEDEAEVERGMCKVLTRLGRTDEARPAMARAVTLYEGVAQADPTAVERLRTLVEEYLELDPEPPPEVRALAQSLGLG
jgi:tetratricopeptide (TPR) repeat protein